MTGLLVRLFVKDADNTADPAVRGRYARLAGVTGIVLNLLLFAGETDGGASRRPPSPSSRTPSTTSRTPDPPSSPSSDSASPESTRDKGASHGATAGWNTSPPSSWICSSILVGAELLKSSFDKILHPSLPEVSVLTPLPSGRGGARQAVAVLLLSEDRKDHRFGGDQSHRFRQHFGRGSHFPGAPSPALIARFAEVGIDGWAGLLVAGFILFTGIRAAKETIDLLLGAPPDPAFIEEIREYVKNYPEVVGIHDLMVHDYGPGRKFISFHAEVPSDSDINYAHDVIDCIERDMHEKFGCIVTIHLDPIVTGNREVDEMRALAEEAAKEVDPAFTIHDFRMTSGGKHTNLIFDLCIPADCKREDEEAAKEVAERISRKNPNCFAVIHPEHPFVLKGRGRDAANEKFHRKNPGFAESAKPGFSDCFLPFGLFRVCKKREHGEIYHRHRHARPGGIRAGKV